VDDVRDKTFLIAIDDVPALHAIAETYTNGSHRLLVRDADRTCGVDSTLLGNKITLMRTGMNPTELISNLYEVFLNFYDTEVRLAKDELRRKLEEEAKAGINEKVGKVYSIKTRESETK
jgi:hypothetical protein